MAVNDVIGIKYMIPKLNFVINPATSQSYTLYYRKWASSSDDSVAWTQSPTTYTANVNGENTSRVSITGLDDNSSYQFKLVNNNDSTNVYIQQFFTGTVLGLSDSPYYNKLLFPGQIYDWYGTDYNVLDLPSSAECTCYYKLDSHYSESITAVSDSWCSMLSMPLPSSPDEDLGKYKKCTQTFTEDVDISMLGYYVNGGRYLALPHVKWNDTTKAYETLEYDFDGTISAYGLSGNHWKIGFVFYCEPGSLGTSNMTLINVDTTKYVSAVHKYKIYINTNKVLCSYISEGDTAATATANTVTSTISVSEGKLYYAFMDTSTFTLIEATYAEGTGFTLTSNSFSAPSPSSPNKTDFNSVDNKIKTPFCFGDDSTSGLIIGKVLVNPGDGTNETLVKKLLIPSTFAPAITISCTSGSTVKSYKPSTKFLVTTTSKKASFLIPLDIFTKLGISVTDTITNVTATLTSETKTLDTKTFSGFSFPDGSTTVTMPGLLDTSNYLEDSFDVNFSTSSDRVSELQRYFFTKHGTWGGYNGGVNGHLIYFDANGNLILEQHGDHYKGTVTGVSKESKATTYTGYGEPLSLNGSFDTRTNKNCLRTGSALVSNKYIGYGEIDVWWRFPVGLWGVCPAIWLFHYIELSDADYRFDLSPWNKRNKQGSASDGYYRVVNNEIDIELPSQDTNGSLDLVSLPKVYFDPDAMDDKFRIDITGDGTYRLSASSAPNSIRSWVKEKSTIAKRYEPSYNTCKFNNWQGELYNGNGWRVSQDDYVGVGDGSDTTKEEYLALLTRLSDNTNGYADGQFHKWTIKWLPGKTVLYVDDVKIRENKCFVPFNVMKLTIAGWFPTMKLSSDNAGVIDADGIRGTAGAVVNASNTNFIGTWAGNEAPFEIAQFIVNRVKYTRYKTGDVVEGYTFQSSDFTGLGTYGESFPESGLRQFVKQ